MNLLGGSIPIGRLFGIRIEIHMLFLLWIGFRLFSAGSDWPQALYFSVLLFTIVLVHEFGHCFGARMVGGWAEQILLWPLGGLAFAHAPMTPWAQFVTVAAGPLVNVIFCVVSGTSLMVLSGHWTAVGVNPFDPISGPAIGAALAAVGDQAWGSAVVEFLITFYWLNLMLLCFNLLPIYPLDGGQLFHVLLWTFIGLRRGLEVACQIGIAGAILLGIWGIQSGNMMLTVIALFTGMSSYGRLQQARMGMVMDERIKYAPVKVYNRRPFLERVRRWFGMEKSEPAENPNPGGWETKVNEQSRLDEEVDRILKKVKARGMHSLSYVERQTLERASRLRQEEDTLR